MNGASRNFHFMSAFVVDSYLFLINYGWALVGFSAWCTWKSRALSYCPASQVPNMCLFEMMCQFFEEIWLLVDCILTFLAVFVEPIPIFGGSSSPISCTRFMRWSRTKSIQRQGCHLHIAMEATAHVVSWFTYEKQWIFHSYVKIPKDSDTFWSAN